MTFHYYCCRYCCNAVTAVRVYVSVYVHTSNSKKDEEDGQMRSTSYVSLINHLHVYEYLNSRDNSPRNDGELQPTFGSRSASGT